MPGTTRCSSVRSWTAASRQARGHVGAPHGGHPDELRRLTSTSDHDSGSSRGSDERQTAVDGEGVAVMYDASAESRNVVAAATSQGVPCRPSGTGVVPRDGGPRSRPARAACRSGPERPRWHGYRAGPPRVPRAGRARSAPPSRRRRREDDFRAEARPGPDEHDRPTFGQPTMACLAIRNGPRRLTAKVASQSSAEVCRNPPPSPMPALHTTPSNCPPVSAGCDIQRPRPSGDNRPRR